MIKKILTVLAVLPLGACSSGPSEGDMNAAVQKSVEENNKQMAALGGMFGGAGRGMTDKLKVEAPQVKKIGCKEDGQNAYICDIELVTKDGKKVTPARFVKASDGWTITR